MGNHGHTAAATMSQSSVPNARSKRMRTKQRRVVAVRASTSAAILTLASGTARAMAVMLDVFQRPVTR